MILKVENKKTILWYRRDLRVEDVQLLSIEGEVLPIFIFDKEILNTLEKEDKRVDYIFKRVLQLKENLRKINLDLLIFYAKPTEVFNYLKDYGFNEVYASIDYDNYAKNRDLEISKIIKFNSLQDNYIYNVDEILKADKSPYVVFSPYFKEAKRIYVKEHSLEYKKQNNYLYNYSDFNFIIEFDNTKKLFKELKINSIGFNGNSIVYKNPKVLLEQLEFKIDKYEENRDFLNLDATSNLSLDIRFGIISVREILRYLIKLKRQKHQTEAFFRQLVFRDFYAYLLFHFPKLHKEDFKKTAPYSFDKELYESFISAKTGVPIIDAGVTELITTGNMHNRVRMIVASFFCKHLMLPWQEGEKFFAKYLMDYDAASNILSWQWSSSTGVDAQPYFRVFNPYSQSKKFDKDAIYIKKYLPILKDIEAKNLHDEEFLFNTEIKDYVKPIVKHSLARVNFLQKAKSIK